MDRYALRFISKDNLLCNEITFADYEEAESKLDSYLSDNTGLFNCLA